MMTSKPLHTETPSPVRRSIAVIGLLAAALALARCDDESVVGPGTDAALHAGVYAAATTPVDGIVGAITVHPPGLNPFDLVLEGAGLTLVLSEDGTTAGRLSIPDGVHGVDAVDADLTGRWRLEEGAVRLDLDADVFLRDIGLVRDEHGLEGEAAFDGTVVRVRLVRIVGFEDPSPGPVPGPVDLSSLRFAADLVVGRPLDDLGQRSVRGTLTITNGGGEDVSFEVGGCPVFLEGTREDGRAWRQRDHVACIAIARRVSIEPGGSVELLTPLAWSGEILGDPRVGATVRFGVVLPRPGEPSIVVDAGVVELEGITLR